jgi:adenosylhomocysteine nucleosidase
MPAVLGIITALPAELAAVEAAIPKAERQQVKLICGGEGAENATRAVQQLLSAPDAPPLVCSTGFCGGLVEGLAVGDIVLAEAILGPKEGERYAVEFEPLGLDGLRLALSEARVKHQVGAIVSVTEAVCESKRKRELGAMRKALAADMESFAIASAGRAEARVFALRVVSDAVSDELPAEIGTFLDEKGRVRLGSVARFALRSPANARTLLRLKSQMAKAAANLTAAWRAVWAVMPK